MLNDPEGRHITQIAETLSRELAPSFSRNSLLSVGRLVITTAIAFVLPSYLTHRLSVRTYSAWILILQMGAYVSYLDLGIQTGIAKYVAEYEARGDAAGSSARASAGFGLMVLASLLGVFLTGVLAWRVPRIFVDMPPSLFREMRLSVLLVGCSLAFGLLCSICSSIFLGLQRYTIPVLVSVANRLLSTVVIIVAVSLHQSLAVMSAVTAAVNILTGALQIGAWRRFARHVRLSLSDLDLVIVKQMVGYCSTLAIWTAGMLCVSGLDVTIVGRYDFGQTAFYSIATLPANFAISIMGAALAPLLPTASALGVQQSPAEMGKMLGKVTRLSSVLLVVAGLPLLVGGYWILLLWVGPAFAIHTLPYLRILVLANVLRNMCLPYASMLVATNCHRVAIAASIAEAAVNLAASIYLVRHVGAIGVAYGTLAGSTVSVGMHLAVSMQYTYWKLAITRARLFLDGLARPLLIAFPSLLLIRKWWPGPVPSLTLPLWISWAALSLLIAWFLALTNEERQLFLQLIGSRLKPRTS